MTIQEQAQKEFAMRQLEQRHAKERDSLYEFIFYTYLHEKKLTIDENRHIKLICEKLEDVFYGRIKRLMINVPPRSLKTQIVSIMYPARCLWKQNDIKFMDISYSSTLAQRNSLDCRDIYKSHTYLSIFPRRGEIKDDQDTKQHRETTAWWQYYSAWSTWSITWLWADIIIMDDPLKPDEWNSEVVRTWVNNNYHSTIYSRLNNKSDGAIIIIMQRLHDDDLCWHLIELEQQGGEKRDKVVIQAIAEDDEEYRKKWESFFEKRFPLAILEEMKKWDKQIFSSQYQQEPTNKETQEFHQEWIKYHWNEACPTPKGLRIFTAVDPAFKQWQQNDQTSIITAGFSFDNCYILEQTSWKRTADVMQDKIIYHIKKREPENIGIESIQAQSMISTFLKREMDKQWFHTTITEIWQTKDKNTRIRKLIPLYRDWCIYHNMHNCQELEQQLYKFPKWRHDDCIDALQMLYDMYILQPNTWIKHNQFRVTRDINWNPSII